MFGIVTKIMVEVLSVLSLATKQIKQGRLSRLSYSEFSLENEVFKPFFCGQTVGLYVTFVAAIAGSLMIM